MKKASPLRLKMATGTFAYGVFRQFAIAILGALSDLRLNAHWDSDAALGKKRSGFLFVKNAHPFCRTIRSLSPRGFRTKIRYARHVQFSLLFLSLHIPQGAKHRVDRESASFIDGTVR